MKVLGQSPFFFKVRAWINSPELNRFLFCISSVQKCSKRFIFQTTKPMFSSALKLFCVYHSLCLISNQKVVIFALPALAGLDLGFSTSPSFSQPWEYVNSLNESRTLNKIQMARNGNMKSIMYKVQYHPSQGNLNSSILVHNLQCFHRLSILTILCIFQYLHHLI